jgi:hypothetical protein
MSRMPVRADTLTTRPREGALIRFIVPGRGSEFVQSNECRDAVRVAEGDPGEVDDEVALPWQLLNEKADEILGEL